MDLISGLRQPHEPAAFYIAPSNVGSIQVFGGIAPVSVGGDSIGGAIQVNSPDPQFAVAGQGVLAKGEAGAFYRSNGNASGGNISATGCQRQGEPDLQRIDCGIGQLQGRRRLQAGWLAFTDAGQSWVNSTKLAARQRGRDVHVQIDESFTRLALRNENSQVELKLAKQDIPYQGFPTSAWT